MQLTTRGGERRAYKTGKAGTATMKPYSFRYENLEQLKKLAFDKGMSINSLICHLCDKALKEGVK
jgi:hypothetical protein